jgi:hypothetical protein
MLIRQYKPCFNISQNDSPTPLPDTYLPPGVEIRCSRSLRRLQYQAEQAIRNDHRRKWLAE